jgi:hypothetical protein
MPLGERPLWQWGKELGADLLALSSVVRVLPPVLGDAVPNLVQRPLSMWQVAGFVRRADLLAEAAHLAERGTPLTIVWSDRDRLVPHAAFAALCASAGVAGHVVAGFHNWLIVSPSTFADIVWRAAVDAGVVDHVLVPPRAVSV